MRQIWRASRDAGRAMITNPDHSRWRAVVNRGAAHVLPSSGVRCQRGGQATPRVAAHHLTEAES